MTVTYSKSTQLSSTTLLPDGQDLRELAGHTQRTSPGLEVCHGLRINQSLVEQERVNTGRNHRNERGRSSRAIREGQHQDAHHHILHGNHGGLAVRAEGKLVAHAVRQGDEQAGGLQRVGHERHAGRGARSDQLQDLGHLHDRTGANDGNAQRLGDRQRCACGVLGDIEIHQQRVVTGRADQGDDGIVYGFGEGRDDGSQVGLERVDEGLLDGLHDLLHGGGVDTEAVIWRG